MLLFHHREVKNDLLYKYAFYSTVKVKWGMLMEIIKPLYIGENMKLVSKLFFSNKWVYSIAPNDGGESDCSPVHSYTPNFN